MAQSREEHTKGLLDAMAGFTHADDCPCLICVDRRKENHKKVNNMSAKGPCKNCGKDTKQEGGYAILKLVHDKEIGYYRPWKTDFYICKDCFKHGD